MKRKKKCPVCFKAINIGGKCDCGYDDKIKKIPEKKSVRIKKSINKIVGKANNKNDNDTFFIIKCPECSARLSDLDIVNRFCPNCEHVLSDSEINSIKPICPSCESMQDKIKAMHCKYCGENLYPKKKITVCPECNNKYDSTYKYCDIDGKELVEEKLESVLEKVLIPKVHEEIPLKVCPNCNKKVQYNSAKCVCGYLFEGYKPQMNPDISHLKDKSGDNSGNPFRIIGLAIIGLVLFMIFSIGGMSSIKAGIMGAIIGGLLGGLISYVIESTSATKLSDTTKNILLWGGVILGYAIIKKRKK